MHHAGAAAALISLALVPLCVGLAVSSTPCKHSASSSGGSRDSALCRVWLWGRVRGKDLCAQGLEVVMGKEKRERKEGTF